MEVSAPEADSLWKSSFGDAPRPELYTSTTDNEDGFLPLNDPQHFVSDISNMTHAQLYAAGQNGQRALKMAQDEYLLLGTLISQFRGKTTRANPQNPVDDEVFENRKESSLYGYKYEAFKPALLNGNADEISEMEKRDVQFPQEPFLQGGFVPTEKQYRAMLAKLPKNATDEDISNLDGWKPIERKGVKLIPRQHIHRDEYDRSMLSLRGTELERLYPADSIDSPFTPSKAIDKRLARVDSQKRSLPTDTQGGSFPTSAFRNGHEGPPIRSESLLKLQDADDSPTPKRRKLESSRQGAAGKPKSRPNGTINLAELDSLPLETLIFRKWQADELLTYVRYKHSWLHSDPQKALKIKESLLQAENPVRSWSMHRTWGDWKKTGKDKRPRNKDGTQTKKNTSRKAHTITNKAGGQESPAPQSSRKNSPARTATPVADGNTGQQEKAEQPINDEVGDQAPTPAVTEQGDVVEHDLPSAPTAPVVPPKSSRKEEDIADSRKRRASIDASQSDSPTRRQSTDVGKAEVSNLFTPVRRSLRTTPKGST